MSGSNESSNDFKQEFENRLNKELQMDIPGNSSNLYEDVEDDSQLLLPSGERPGIATAAILERGLQIPSKNRYVSSGFPYPEQLASLNVTEVEWATFTSLITSAAKLTSDQWSTTIGKGLGVLVVSGLMIGFLSPIPAFAVGQKIRRSIEVDNLKKALKNDTETSQLQQLISEWNENFFKPRGVMVRVDLPSHANNLLAEKMDVSTANSSSSSLVGSSSISGSSPRPSAEKRRGSLGGLTVFSGHHSKASGSSTTGQSYQEIKRAKEKAASRGRIVILPLKENKTSSTSDSIRPSTDTSEANLRLS